MFSSCVLGVHFVGGICKLHRQRGTSRGESMDIVIYVGLGILDALSMQ